MLSETGEQPYMTSKRGLLTILNRYYGMLMGAKKKL